VVERYLGILKQKGRGREFNFVKVFAFALEVSPGALTFLVL